MAKKIICPNCGTELPSFAKYCKHCGTEVFSPKDVEVFSSDYKKVLLWTLCIVIIGVGVWASFDEYQTSGYSFKSPSIKTSGYSNISFNSDSMFASYLCSHTFANSDGYILTFDEKSEHRLLGELVVEVRCYLNGNGQKIWLGTGPVSVDYWNGEKGHLSLALRTKSCELDYVGGTSHYIVDESGDRYYEQ